MDYAFWEMIALKISVVALLFAVLLIRHRTDKTLKILIKHSLQIMDENKEITSKLRSMEAKNDTINI